MSPVLPVLFALMHLTPVTRDAAEVRVASAGRAAGLVVGNPLVSEGARVPVSCVIQEAWCAGEWWDVGLEGVELGLTFGATIAALEACGATLGLGCFLTGIGFHESGEAMDDFVAALSALRACRNEN